MRVRLHASGESGALRRGAEPVLVPPAGLLPTAPVLMGDGSVSFDARRRVGGSRVSRARGEVERLFRRRLCVEYEVKEIRDRVWVFRVDEDDMREAVDG